MPEPFNTLMCDVKDEWLTPPSITESLGHFDLDPCQPIDPPFVHADKGFNILDNGLSQVWMVVSGVILLMVVRLLSG